MARKRKKIYPDIHIDYLGEHRDVIPIIAGWIFDEWSFLYHGKTSGHVERFLRERVRKRKLPITFVAFKGDKPVGTVSLKEHDMESRKELTPWVTSLYVVRQWRRKGVGSSLMKTVEEKAAAMGIRRLFLFTADPALAEGFYAKSGWKIKEEMDYHSYSVLIMEKELREQASSSEKNRGLD